MILQIPTMWLFLWVFLMFYHRQTKRSKATKCPEISGLVRKKICVAWNPGIIFQSPEVFKSKSNFLIFKGTFKNFDNCKDQKIAKLVRNLVLWWKVSKFKTDFRCSPEKCSSWSRLSFMIFISKSRTYFSLDISLGSGDEACFLYMDAWVRSMSVRLNILIRFMSLPYGLDSLTTDLLSNIIFYHPTVPLTQSSRIRNLSWYNVV